MTARAYSEDQLVEQPAIGLFANPDRALVLLAGLEEGFNEGST